MREASLTFLFGMVAEQVDAHILIEVVSYNGSTLHDGEMKRSTSGGFESPYEKKRYDLDVNAGSIPAHFHNNDTVLADSVRAKWMPPCMGAVRCGFESHLSDYENHK